MEHAPSFSASPGVGGIPRAALPYLHRPAARRPPSLIAQRQSHQLNVRDRETREEILRIVIENPANHPISKQSVIYLVRIISIERTWTISRPFGLKILRSAASSQELFSLHGLMFAYANRKP